MHTQLERAAPSLGELGSGRLAALAVKAGFGDELPAMQRLFQELLATSGVNVAGAAPAWRSDVCDDHTPFEFSVAVGGASQELRVLVESREGGLGIDGNRRWGLRVNQWLRETRGLRLERFEQLRDLFLPDDAQGVFSIWHAVSFWPGRAPEFKCYLNLEAQGAARAPQLAAEALERLGFGRAWPLVMRTLLRRGPELDRLMYFSLDLSPTTAPRVKLYARHYAATTDELELAASGARGHQPGRLTEFCRVLSGGDGPYLDKGPVSCLGFLDSELERPSASTIYFPIAAYAPNDRVARNRIASYLVLHELPLAPYVGPLEAFANRRLEDGIGMQSYASLRWSGDRPRVTVYFSPEAYSVGPARPTLMVSARPATALVERHERSPIIDHPYFARLRREPADPRRLWTLLANFMVGVVDPFPRRLSGLAARTDDNRLRSLLVKQLNDGLGAGDLRRADCGRYERLFAALESWAPPSPHDALVRPGREFGVVLDRAYLEAAASEGLGASLVVELYGRQIDRFISAELRRYADVPRDQAAWPLDGGEADRVDALVALARRIPNGPVLEAAWRGAELIAESAWRFFDAIGEVSFA